MASADVSNRSGGLPEDDVAAVSVERQQNSRATAEPMGKFSGPRTMGKLQKGLAPITSADLFKTEAMLQTPKSSIEVTRFLSREAQLRIPSSLKASSAGLSDDVISLSTGRPSTDTYPFNRLDLEFTSPSHITRLENGSERGDSHNCSSQTPIRATVARDDPESAIDLSVALSYGYSLGSEQLVQFLTNHVAHVHSPQYSDWELCLTIGSTSALEIALRNLANPGDFILAEEYTYSGTIEAAKPLGINLVSIAMDANGLCPISLDETLSSWNISHPGEPKPKILYTIPTGQNPTGITQPLARRREVLDVVEKHDLLIIEDDPYYYLSFATADSPVGSPLILSYLSLSAVGRVLRLDSTSKILAPGLRLGWLTAPRKLVETFQAAHDLGIVHPSGLSQVVVYKLLSESWGHGGFARWLQGLAELYRQKAAAITSAMEQNLRRGGLAKICSWTKVEAGMFIWLQIDCGCHPSLVEAVGDMDSKIHLLSDIEDEIYSTALSKGVLCCKGSFFRVPVLEREIFHRGKDDNLRIHFRLTFATADVAKLVKGVERLGMALEAVFALTQ